MDGADLYTRAFVVDTHTHSPHLLPRAVGAAYRAFSRDKPADISFGEAATAGVSALVAKAVGDWPVTMWHPGSGWASVTRQLALIREEAEAAGAVVASGVADVERARADGRLALIAGLEGADAIGADVDRIDELHAAGVRVIVPVHLGDNALGTTCLPALAYLGPVPVPRRRARGLTALGRAAVERMQSLGVVVDASHADEPTALGMVDAAAAPVIASHSGARAVSEFARYLGDDAIRAIASTGGVIGLWPYRSRGRGVADVAALVAHARHVADVVGPEHLCLGTDMNGVPSVMHGYRDERDLPVVATALLDAGFGPTEVEGILGGNALRVLAAAEAAATRPLP